MNKFSVAMSLYALLAFVAWLTLTATVEVNGRNVPIVWIVWALLAMFALRSWLHQQRVRLDAQPKS
ncbi:MAG TPA: hypothetical protein VE998_12440 [Terriglobales bacterium]|nr:hypothetical protein [Terriglobales bacterium]